MKPRVHLSGTGDRRRAAPPRPARGSVCALCRRGAAAPDRRSGIALLVVMIVFVVLSVVVYHLHFNTAMEAKVARVRYGDIVSQDALQFVALNAITTLLDDYQQDLTEGAEAAEAGLAGPGSSMAAGGMPGARAGAPGAGAPVEGGAPTGGGVPPGGNFVPIQVAGGGSQSTAQTAKAYDHKGEKNWYSANDNTGGFEEQVGETKVWYRYVDGESTLDLNRIFGYARVPEEEAEAALAAEAAEAEGEELAEIVAGAPDTETAEEELTRAFLSGSGAQSAAGGAGPGRTNEREATEATDAADEILAQGGLAAADVQAERELTEFEEPNEFRLNATVDMLRRALTMLFSINEDAGFYYSQRYSAEEIATDIVQYVLERRRSPVQNVIYHSSELLNLNSVTPEVYYGPRLGLRMGEEYETLEGCILTRDEFGNIVVLDPYAEDHELEEEEALSEWESMRSLLGDVPGVPTFDQARRQFRQASQYDVALELDEYGREYVPKCTTPLGLRDIFSTFSSGRININTAPIPILYALLPSLSEGVDGEAQFVAFAIDAYRDRMQEELPQEGAIGSVDPLYVPAPDLGQPRRQPPPEEDELAEMDPYAYSDPLGMGALGGYGYDDMAMGLGMGQGDVESNYFTSLDQIELADGWDEGPDDLLRRDMGIDRVSAEQDTLFQRVMDDFKNVMVFRSTYFAVELRAKNEKNPLVKSGVMFVKRDVKKSLLEVILWKALER